MRGFAALLRKELLGYFNTPVAYIVIAGFLVFTSVWLFFIHDFFAADVASLRAYYGVMPLVFVVLVPAVTMRMWSEERSSGTDELLLTLPLRESTLVLGKYCAALFLVLAAILLTVFVPLTVHRLGSFERGEIIGQYLGLVLLAAAGTAIGELCSSVAKNQVSAFISAALILLLLTLVGRINAVVDMPARIAATANYLSLDTHFRSLNRGVLDTRSVMYFLGLSALCLYGTAQILIVRKAR